MKSIDFIFLIEHPKRELPFLKYLANVLRGEGYSVKFISIYFHLFEIYKYKNSVIILPYCLSESNFPFSIIPKNRGFTFINMNWEQILSPISKTSKVILNEARYVYQLYWNLDFKDFLIKRCLIKKNYLIKSVNPTSFMMQFPSNEEFIRYLKSKGLSSFIFVPVNYNWAMMSESRINSRLSLGYSKEDADVYINFSKQHQFKMFNFLQDLVLSGYSVVLRPHPSITVESYIERINSFKVFSALINNEQFFIDDSFSAIDWAKEADLILSNWSTVVYDAYLSGKKAAYYWPEKIPALINAYHTEEPYKISSVSDIEEIIVRNPEYMNEEFNSLIRGLKSVMKRKSDFKFKSFYSFFDILKIVRSFIYLVLVKIKLSKFVSPRILIDYFDNEI